MNINRFARKCSCFYFALVDLMGIVQGRIHTLYTQTHTTTHMPTYTVSTSRKHTRQRVRERKKEREKVRAVSCSVISFLYWNWISVKCEVSFFLSPPPHSPPLTSNSTAAKHAAGCGSLTKLNNTCQESLTHNQLCNTGGSHYVSIFALHWPRSVYYTTKPTLIFI